ncbi:hypothetical protein JW756_02940 [Candidatus Woesearchaeota archaeon]|nr:hypothetical protein [Candidatus Woesearchaeota archaeon]
MRNIIFFITLAVIAIIFSACQQNTIPETPSCPAGFILVGGQCCPDANDNLICDDYEEEAAANATEEETNFTPEPVIVREPAREKERFINQSHLEWAIKNLTAEHREDYIFFDRKYEDATEIYRKFTERSTKWYDYLILNITSEKDYLYTYQSFYDFMKEKYDLDVKNNKIWASDAIDIIATDNKIWDNATYEYKPKLEEIIIEGDKILLETHVYVFIDEYDHYLDYTYMIKASTWCDPSHIVQAEPKSYGINVAPKMAMEDALININRSITKMQNETLNRTILIVKLCKNESMFLKSNS